MMTSLIKIAKIRKTWTMICLWFQTWTKSGNRTRNFLKGHLIRVEFWHCNCLRVLSLTTVRWLLSRKGCSYRMQSCKRWSSVNGSNLFRPTSKLSNFSRQSLLRKTQNWSTGWSVGTYLSKSSTFSLKIRTRETCFTRPSWISSKCWHPVSNKFRVWALRHLTWI